MNATMDGFNYGIVTPLAAYAMACLGGAVGLRCLTRALSVAQPRRAAWLGLSSAALGTGVWITHFVAMMGFTVTQTPLEYDPLTTYASLAVALIMVGTGIFIAAYRGITGTALFTGGTITGLGVASTHYMGMAGIRIGGRLEYNTLTVTASVLIAVVASMAALWAAGQGRGRGFLWSVAASLVMGVGVLGMHYVGMAAVSVHLQHAAAHTSSAPPTEALAVLMIGPVLFLLLVTALVVADPKLVTETDGGGSPRTGTRRTALLPAQRSAHSVASRAHTRTPQHR